VTHSALSLTPRFSGVIVTQRKGLNRFSGFHHTAEFDPLPETAEAVTLFTAPAPTPLKRGVNEKALVQQVPPRHGAFPFKNVAAIARAAFLLAVFISLAPGSAWACAACYGQSDSPMAKGMNWGIFSLLGFIVLVLGGVAAFFIYLARRAAAAPIAASPALLQQAPSGAWIEATSKL